MHVCIFMCIYYYMCTHTYICIHTYGVLVSKSCPTLCDAMDCSPAGSSVHGILQARILEWVSISFSRGSSQPRNWTWVSCIAGRFFTNWAMREAHIHTHTYICKILFMLLLCFKLSTTFYSSEDKVQNSLLLFSHSVVSNSVTPWTAACQASLSFTTSQSLLKLMPIESMMLSNHLMLCCPLLLPSIFLSTRDFSSDLALRIRWPKYWSFSFSISPCNEYVRLISFRVDCFGSPCCPRDSQEFSPAPQFKSVKILTSSSSQSTWMTSLCCFQISTLFSSLPGSLCPEALNLLFLQISCSLSFLRHLHKLFFSAW